MKNRWINWIVGSISGILMSMLVLYLMKSSLYTLFSLGFWLSVVIICALPHCLYVVKKEGYEPTIAVLIMLILSFVITLLYANIVSRTGFMNIFDYSLVLHSFALVSVGFRVLFEYRNKVK